MTEEILQQHWQSWFGKDSNLQSALRRDSVMKDGFSVDDAELIVHGWIRERLMVNLQGRERDVEGDTLALVLAATNWQALAKTLLIQWHIQAKGLVYV